MGDDHAWISPTRSPPGYCLRGDALVHRGLSPAITKPDGVGSTLAENCEGGRHEKESALARDSRSCFGSLAPTGSVVCSTSSATAGGDRRAMRSRHGGGVEASAGQCSLARSVGNSRARAGERIQRLELRQGLGGYAGGVVLSIRCQRMKPQLSHEYAKASSPPSSAWRMEWPSRSTHVAWPHIGHLRDSSTTVLPTLEL